MARAARLRGAAPRALLLPLLLLLLPPPQLLSRAPRPLDAPRRHVRRGPQSWHEAAPSSLAPASTAQETLQPASSPRPPRCGVPDPPDGLSARNRQKRFVLSGGRWEKTDLTYRYWHGDNLPFDGPGGILAHAFFPKTHREGDVHFDYDETWTIGNNQGTDLLQVAAHEFGHVLGLQHTTAAKALMSPFYTFRYPLSLSPDDRRGIQHLYGQPRPAPTSRPPAVGPQAGVDDNEIAPLEPEVPPDACEITFDAVSTIRGELFFFKVGFVWRLRGGRLQPGYPALASRHWQGLPSPVDAAFEDAQGHIWFFQGTQYWVYNGEKPVLGPSPLSELGLLGPPIQAALAWGPEKNKIYFFRDGDYWRFHLSTRRVDNPVPRRVTDWRGVPSEIDAAFQDADGYAYFLRGRLYWKFDPVKVKALEGFPRLVGPDFFGCTEPANTFR
ncbi:stromelysin-3 isoform X3 [Prionailurus viverrinus]|uniref:stromelysin-3 isoform X3 n=1 Tax=Prionailurus viverrinus TaxID=61388 RepID=UPI001FF1993C|nr:stromelysin-3 isoform X3 [Prionailurus viverrinus]